MMDYPRCALCGTYTVNEKERCFYCGTDLKEPRINSLGGQTISSLRSLWINAQWPKLRKRSTRVLPVEKV